MEGVSKADTNKTDTTKYPITTIATRSFCGVYPNSFTNTIAYLTGINKQIASNPNPFVINFQTRELIGHSPQAVWAVAIYPRELNSVNGKPSPTDKGRAVFGSDAGWLGDTTSCKPGKGQFQEYDNPQYFLNTLAWLSGKF